MIWKMDSIWKKANLASFSENNDSSYFFQLAKKTRDNDAALNLPTQDPAMTAARNFLLTKWSKSDASLGDLSRRICGFSESEK